MEEIDHIVQENKMMEDDQLADVDFNVWPLNETDLETLTGIIDNEHIRQPQHEQDAKQKQWKQ